MAELVQIRSSGMDIFDEDSRHLLQISREPEKREYYWNQAFFSIKPLGDEEANPVIITGRDTEDYMHRLQGLEMDETKQYIEIGAGLGGFIPSLVSKFGTMQKRPIVIDPSNYAVMRNLLYLGVEASVEEGYPEEVVGYIRDLRDRAEFYLASNKINLINSGLEEAVQNHPEIIKTADVVVELSLSEPYEKRDFSKLRRSLLGKKGKVFVG